MPRSLSSADCISARFACPSGSTWSSQSMSVFSIATATAAASSGVKASISMPSVIGPILVCSITRSGERWRTWLLSDVAGIVPRVVLKACPYCGNERLHAAPTMPVTITIDPDAIAVPAPIKNQGALRADAHLCQCGTITLTTTSRPRRSGR